MKKWARILYQPVLPLGENKRVLTGSPEHIEFSRKSATEGMVLLKNENDLLPLSSNVTVALFGIAQFDYVKGGGGSGIVHCAYTRNIYDGLKIKEGEGKIKVYDALSAYYKSEYARLQAEKPETLVGQFDDIEIPGELLASAKKNADVAIINISRYSSEFVDRFSERGDFYLSEMEERMVNTVVDNFSKVVVLLNIGGMIDTEWFYSNNKIGAALLCWQGGQEAGLAAADLLVGDENPSGKLTDTFAKRFSDYPFADNFNESEDYVNYTEDIYVGYRYFETVPGMKERVNYPFGFGLSYTDFEISSPAVDISEGRVRISVDVKNIGSRCGKEVVQVYYSAPQGKLGKPARELAAFKKTRLLSPSEAQTLSLEFDINDMASYDDEGKLFESAYVLEAGEYCFYVGNSVRSTVRADISYKLEEDVLVKQLTRCCAPRDLKERLRSDGTLEPLKAFDAPARRIGSIELPTGDKRGMLTDVVDGKLTIDEFLNQLSIEQMIDMCTDSKCIGVCNTACFGGCEEFGIPPLPTTDGPAGVRVLANDNGVYTTCFPCATQMACSWNEELIYDVARAGAAEVKENNMVIWLTPALNIHRNPLCGRNFEYYSEDPLVSGKAAAAVTKGIQSINIAATVKHFACNNKEINRTNSDSRVSERAIREIYIKGFEIAIKEAEPYCLMTAYNKLNGVRTGANYELITSILRGEWGYKGMVTTDWCTLSLLHEEIIVGGNVKMEGNDKALTLQAYKDGKFTRSDIHQAVKYIVELALKLD